MENISIFIGSSNESLNVANLVGRHFDKFYEPTVWEDDIFSLGLSNLENLINNLDNYDFAILVFAPDDIITSRNITSSAPRDNVMFELGLFMGRIGRERTFIICSDDDLKIPSDLDGISIARYRSDRKDANLAAALNSPCTVIKEQIRKHLKSGTKNYNSSRREIETLKQSILELNEKLKVKDEIIEALHDSTNKFLNLIKILQ